MRVKPATGTEHFAIARAGLPGLLAVHAASARSFARHSHDVHGIGVIDAGGHRSASGRGKVEALCGELITVNPGEVHDGVAMGGETRRWRMLYVDMSLFNQEHPGAEWPAPVLRDERLRQAFERLYARCVGGANALAVEEALVLLLRCARMTSAPVSAADRAAPAALGRVRDQLADATTSAPSLAQLAQGVGLDRYRLLRAFTAAYGLPPHAWALQQRLARAQGLIRQGHALAEAAAGAGFADQSHMTRAFRRFRGYTPGAYAAALPRSTT